MRISEADLGKTLWRVLSGASAPLGENLPRFETLPLSIRGALTQTAVAVYDSGDETLDTLLCEKLIAAGWSTDRYNADKMTIPFAQPVDNVSVGIRTMLRAGTCALVAMKDL